MSRPPDRREAAGHLRIRPIQIAAPPADMDRRGPTPRPAVAILLRAEATLLRAAATPLLLAPTQLLAAATVAAEAVVADTAAEAAVPMVAAAAAVVRTAVVVAAALTVAVVVAAPTVEVVRTAALNLVQLPRPTPSSGPFPFFLTRARVKNKSALQSAPSRC